MANYNNLKATINANIKANGNEEITGPILNTVLNQAVTTLGDGWSYKGIATPSMSPGTPDSNVFYIATTAGTYTNFGSLVVAEGEVAILKYNGSWAKEVTGAATAAQVTQLGQKVNPLSEWATTQAFILNTDLWATTSGYKGYLIPCSGKSQYVISSVAGVNVCFAFLKDADIVSGETPNYATGSARTVVYGARTLSGDVPSDAEYLYVSKSVSGTSWMPTSVILDGYDYVKGVQGLLIEHGSSISSLSSSIATINADLTKAEMFACSNSLALNKIIKELYIPASVVADLSTIGLIRVYNGYGGYYGVAFYSGSNTLVLDMRSMIVENVYNLNGGLAIMDVSSVTDYMDFNATLSAGVASLYHQPRLALYVENGDNIPMTSSAGANSGSAAFNKIVSKIYIPASVVSAETLASVSIIRIYNGFGNYYGITLYDSSYNIILYIRRIYDNAPNGYIERDGAYVKGDWTHTETGYQDYPRLALNVAFVQDVSNFPEINIRENTAKIAEISETMTGKYFTSLSPIAKDHPLTYVGNGQITNAATYPDGTIFAGKSNGSIVKIDRNGNETTLLSLTGNDVEWRCFFLDDALNLYVSPHATHGSLTMTDRGLYRLPYGGSSFTKVISLYNPSSTDTPETQSNDDTIWTMCEDIHGYLYAGVYCHSVRYAPRIYRSTDGGETWVDYYNFLNILPNGHHVHCITYNQYNDALYCIIGEVNTILKSSDQGTTWTNLQVACEDDKGTMLFAVPDGIIVGSDSAWSLIMSKLYADDKTIKTNSRVWANTCFAIRQSDVTGWIYAFGKIDSSVNVTDYFPPIDAITDPSALQTWQNSSPTYLAKWTQYHNRVDGWYPDDAIRPQHFGILRSKDNGETWEVVYREFVSSASSNGFYCVSEFRNGECLCGRIIGGEVVQPIILSDGKHDFGTSGIDNDSELFAPLS